MAATPQRLISALLILASATASFTAKAVADDEPFRRTLTLAATGAIKTTPDKVEIATGVTSEAPSARDALDKNTKAMTEIVETLKSDGIEAKNIQTVNFAVTPVYDQKKEGRAPVLVGYRVTNSVRIIVNDTGKLGAILDKVVTVGANEIGSIEFGVSEPEVLKDEARKDAMRNAIEHAKLYAQAAGVELGPILTVAEEDGGYIPRYAAAPAAMEMAKSVPIEAGTTMVEVRLRVTWELK